MPTVFGGFDSVARFNIISMVSPVSSHTASSQTRFEKLTAHIQTTRVDRDRRRETEVKGERVIVKH